MQVPASRTNHVKLYINGEYFGLYLNVEHYDEEFTKSRFDGEGNLYKCTYGADLRFRGTSADGYKLDYYELKNEDAPFAYEDLAHFIDVLNNTPSDKMECELEHVFNVNSYLRCLVFDVLSGNWDGPNYNKNNFYLYHNPNSGLFEFMPYDLDNTLGVDFLGQEWSNRNIYSWSKANASRPLFQKVMAQETYRKRFSYLLDKALNEYFNPTDLGDRISQIKELIGEAAIADTVRTLDYGYSISDFNNSFGYFSKDHVKYGIVDFVNRRYISALAQLDSIETVGSITTWHTATLKENEDSVTFSIAIQSDDSIDQEVVVTYNWEYQSAIWTDTLVLIDSATNTYSTTITWHPTLSIVSYLFTVGGENGNLNFPICNMYTLEKPKNDIKLFINELMADNSSSIWDEDEEYEDWIELFYDGDKTTNLNGYYLTDDLSNPFKYALPTFTAVPGSFKIIWADNDGGTNHANFKLSKNGETIALFDSYGVLIDSVTYSVLQTNNTWGRKIDGEIPWVIFSETTPGYTNLGINKVEEFSSELDVYPNPSSNVFILNSEKPLLNIRLYNTNGQLLDVPIENQVINTSSLPTGIYLLSAKIGGEIIRKKLIKID